MSEQSELASRYQLEELLSWRGTVRTFLGTHPETHEAVAVKVISPGTVPEAGALQQRFRSTAGVLKTLDHPNLPLLLDFGVSGEGDAYLVFGWLDCQPLDQMGALAPRQILPYMLQAIEGLECLALHGLVHLNLAPDNLVVTRRGEIKLAGLGRSLMSVDWQSSPAASGQVEGSVFTAPELRRLPGAGGALWRADLYALAMMTVRLLEAEVEGEGTDRPRVRLPGSSSRHLQASRTLEEALERCLHQDPSQRLVSYSKFGRVLQHSLPRTPRADGVVRDTQAFDVAELSGELSKSQIDASAAAAAETQLASEVEVSAGDASAPSGAPGESAPSETPDPAATRLVPEAGRDDGAGVATRLVPAHPEESGELRVLREELEQTLEGGEIKGPKDLGAEAEIYEGFLEIRDDWAPVELDLLRESSHQEPLTAHEPPGTSPAQLDEPPPAPRRVAGSGEPRALPESAAAAPPSAPAPRSVAAEPAVVAKRKAAPPAFETRAGEPVVPVEPASAEKPPAPAPSKTATVEKPPPLPAAERTAAGEGTKPAAEAAAAGRRPPAPDAARTTGPAPPATRSAAGREQPIGDADGSAVRARQATARDERREVAARKRRPPNVARASAAAPKPTAPPTPQPAVPPSPAEKERPGAGAAPLAARRLLGVIGGLVAASAARLGAWLAKRRAAAAEAKRSAAARPAAERAPARAEPAARKTAAKGAADPPAAAAEPAAPSTRPAKTAPPWTPPWSRVPGGLPVAAGVLGAVLVTAPLAIWVLGGSEAPPPPAAELPAPPPPPPVAPVVEQPQPAAAPALSAELETAIRLLAEDRLLEARAQLARLGSLEEEGELAAELCEPYRAAEGTLLQLRRDQVEAELGRAIADGDVELLRRTLVDLSSPEAAILTESSRGRRLLADSRRAREQVESFEAAIDADDPELALNTAFELDAAYPSFSHSVRSRERASAAAEREADLWVEEGRLEEAEERLELLRSLWPERPGVAARLRDIRSQLDSEARFETLLTAVQATERRNRPHEGLRMLEGVRPSGEYAERFREAGRRLRAQLRELDERSPTVVLKPGSEVAYRKGEPVVVELEIEDDYEVTAVTFWARPTSGGEFSEIRPRQQGDGSYRVEIEPSFHGNKPILFWVSAQDRSGHTGLLGSLDEPIELKRKRWLRG